MTTMIETENLKYAYPTDEEGNMVFALRGVDLRIEKGTFVVVLGHNGSGKSTLAKTFNGVLLPAGGRVYVEGMDTCDPNLLLAIRQRVGMVFQNPDNQIVANVVEEDVAFAPENLGVPSEEIRKRVDDALAAVGMSEFVRHAPHLLSGGQKQRVAVARACITDPRLLLADEPTGALDSRSADQLLDLFEQINREGQTILMVTHSAKAASRASRVLFIKDGEVFHQLYRGGRTNEAMFTQIADTLTALATGGVDRG